MHIEQSEEETREQVQKYHVEKKPPSYSKWPIYDHSSGSSHHGGYNSRPSSQSDSSYQSWGSSSYHHSQGNIPYQNQGDSGCRGSGSGGHQDSYKYKDSPPQNRDFGRYDQPMWLGEGYRPPHPRSMQSSPAHYYDKYPPAPPPLYYDQGPPPPPNWYPPPPHFYTPPPHPPPHHVCPLLYILTNVKNKKY